MKLVLLGYMGSGKSTVGKILAKNLNISFYDLDDFIEENEKQSISEIFNSKGEIYFRKIEKKYLINLLHSDENIILSVGGGTPCYGDNLNIIKNNALSVYLKTGLHTLYTRLISEKEKRPLISEIKDDNLKEFIAKHLFERSPFFEQANLIIKCDEISTEEICSRITSKINLDKQ